MDAQSNPQDPFNLHRFVEAQTGIHDRALAELKGGRKQSHWMWFIFPQLDGLGSSSTARYYAIKSLNEAKAYLDHPLLGPRLLECCETLLRIKGNSASEILGFPDDLKLHSSMTLFACVADSDSVFAHVLDQYYEGQSDQRTLELLKIGPRT